MRVVTEATAASVQSALRAIADPERAIGSARFFKTGPGQYGEGDVFLGVSVPSTRAIVAQHPELPLRELDVLLDSDAHEDRLAALLLLVRSARASRHPRTGDAGRSADLVDFYLRAVRRGRVNNWDLVDASSDTVLGEHLVATGGTVPDALTDSPSLWERRVAILATFAFTRHGDCAEALRVAERLLADREDLIQKALGWMLREVGKRVARADLLAFLDAHAPRMSSIALSYATEHLDPDTRALYRSRRRARVQTERGSE